MIRIYKFITLFFIFFIALISCRDDSLYDDFSLDNDNCKIKFNVASVFHTKGMPVAEMQNLSIFAYYTFENDFTSRCSPNFMYNQLIERNEDEWTYAPEKYWPNENNQKISFFSYSPFSKGIYDEKTNTNGNGLEVSDNFAEGAPLVTYTIPEKVENQPDLLVALPLKNCFKEDVPITLSYHHVLACLSFRLAGKSSQHVTGIGVSNIYNSGTINIDISNGIKSVSWLLDESYSDKFYYAGLQYETGHDYVIPTSTLSDVTAEDGCLMVIPQTIPKEARLIVKFDDGTSRQVALNSIVKKWEPNKCYCYDIDIKSNVDVLIVDYTEFEPSNSYILKTSKDYDIEYRIPISKVNLFWGDEGASLFGSDDLDNVLEENDKWTVALLWQDYKNMVSSKKKANDAITLSKSSGKGPHDYFSIYVPKKLNSSIKGNFLIALAKGNKAPQLKGSYGSAKGTVLWSWHFWLTDYDPYDEGSVKQNASSDGSPWMWSVAGGDMFRYRDANYSDTPTNNCEYGIVNPWGTLYSNSRIMDRSLGAPKSGSSGDEFIYYQFGRKDPLPLARTLYRYNNETVQYEIANGPVSIAETVRHPLTVYINNGESGNWCNTTSVISRQDIVWHDPQINTGSGDKSFLILLHCISNYLKMVLGKSFHLVKMMNYLEVLILI